MGLTLKIDDRFRNRKVDFFSSFEMEMKFNSPASTFSFEGYYDPNNIEHFEMYCALHYHGVTLDYENQQGDIARRVMSGTITSHAYRESNVKQSSSFGGYSIPGVLGDCTIPTSSYPLQHDGLNLRQIAQRLIAPFPNLEMVIDPAVSARMEKPFPTTTAGDTQKIAEYLAGLAKQKNVIMSHDNQGRLFFTQANTEAQPIMHFDLREGTPKGTFFAFTINGSAMHSVITAQKQADADNDNAGQSTIRNPLVVRSRNVFRPITVSQGSGDDNDTSLAARRALGNELRAIILRIEISDWDLDSNFIEPNNIITVIAPHLYIVRQERFFIESINYTGNTESTTAVLNCVLPGVYSNTTPVNIFRNINLHALDESN